MALRGPRSATLAADSMITLAGRSPRSPPAATDRLGAAVDLAGDLWDERPIISYDGTDGPSSASGCGQPEGRKVPRNAPGWRV